MPASTTRSVKQRLQDLLWSRSHVRKGRKRTKCPAGVTCQDTRTILFVNGSVCLRQNQKWRVTRCSSFSQTKEDSLKCVICILLERREFHSICSSPVFKSAVKHHEFQVIWFVICTTYNKTASVRFRNQLFSQDPTWVLGPSWSPTFFFNPSRFSLSKLNDWRRWWCGVGWTRVSTWGTPRVEDNGL